MKSNYNDIIDIILTLVNDDEIRDYAVVSGSIVPYLISSKESNEFHSDLYILISEKRMDKIRKRMKQLSKEYLFDIINDSRSYSKDDYGFKLRYEDTYVGVFPYSFKENIFKIKTYSINKQGDMISLKTKTIRDITRGTIIRQISFSNDNIISIMSPEYVLIDKKLREKQQHNPTKETMDLLNKISDESILKVLNKSMINMNIDIKQNKIRRIMRLFK